MHYVRSVIERFLIYFRQVFCIPSSQVLVPDTLILMFSKDNSKSYVTRKIYLDGRQRRPYFVYGSRIRSFLRVFIERTLLPCQVFIDSFQDGRS